ncbi:TPT-domain-containing protein [Hypomontagnella monticulosa]|nr:TPT-domain-containing protein [Hypomontagnella monticulosa]
MSSQSTLHPAFYIASWIFFSNLTILFNKWLIDDAGFPVILTWWHMTFATLATQVLARTTGLLDGRHKIQMTTQLYMKLVVPIGLLYSGSMVTSTLVYLYLNVPFIQMLKSAAPVITLLIGWLWGVENPTYKTFAYIMLIVTGVALASLGEIHFSWPGFLYQVGGTIFESVRIIMIQSLMSSSGLSMDPLVSLYYYAPVCAVTNLVLSLASEWSSVVWIHASEAGLGMLLLNAVVAFLLNVSSVLLIGKTSALILVLSGILKNILLVVAAVVIWGTPITFIQLIGYSWAIIGLFLYQSGWEGTSEALKAGASWITDHPLYRRYGKRRVWFLITSSFIALVLVIIWARGERISKGGPSTTKTVEGVDRSSSGWLTWLGMKDGKSSVGKG